MPRCARSSARWGPTPLIMRTSVPRFIVIDKCVRRADDGIFFISFPTRTYRKGETCAASVRTDRVSVPCSKGGGSCDGRPPDRFRQARAAVLGGGGSRRRVVRLQVLFPGVPGSVR